MDCGSTDLERQRIVVQGIVQGVGFRPFVYGLAAGMKLAGFVRNDSEGVTIEIEGEPPTLAAFRAALQGQAPPLARIDEVLAESIEPSHETVFAILHSQSGAQRRTLISPDVATCDDCLRELLDNTDRRFGYPFTNCTNCGPRFTIVADVPYDRNKTTMREFSMCPLCQGEYDDPLDRRFHAQPNACPACGPQVCLEYSTLVSRRTTGDHGRSSASGAEAILEAQRLLSQGKILAIKGLGGYHLACDALDAAAVSRLRERKQREAKPFALMAPDLETARQICYVNEAEAELLQSRRRPIVLLERRPGCPVAPGIAPRHHTLGVMLPYTPLHTLLLQAFMEGRDAQRPAVLVMTSGNVSDEPIAYRDDEALDRLAQIADHRLIHNRAIHMRCDDSVARIAAGGEQLFRRARGYAPEPILLKREFPVQLLACGGHQKNTFCLGKGRQAFVSHHIGDLENLETLRSFQEGIDHFQRLFDIRPEAVAFDLHPDYLATKYAFDLDSPHKIGVQHHHAHIASVMAEHGLEGPVIGVAADGSGYGRDGAVWGGEILVAGLEAFERAAHLPYVPLPGGEQAIRQPWRMAAVYLQRACGADFLVLDIPFVKELDRKRWTAMEQMIRRGLNCPPTSSLGRLFDAVAALVGVRTEAAYEGQAAIELEMRAQPAEEAYPFNVRDGDPAQLDVMPLIRAIVRDLQRAVPVPVISGRFHRTIAELLAAGCRQTRARTGLSTVALSGGVFQNRLLLEQLTAILEAKEFHVVTNRRVPPNDGGVSLGQAAVAAARLEKLIRS
jgi:hydrogenase maturation protein HypF